jgi:hypothetical protein
MAFRDRVYTPATAKALLSWRLAVGAAIAIATAIVGLHPAAASLIGLAVYAGLVYTAMPPGRRRAAQLDPFALGEPWRHFVSGALRSRRALEATVARVGAGPLRDRLLGIAERLEHAVDESWAIAKRGDEIDDAVKRIDPVRLRSRLQTLRQQQAELSAQRSDAEALVSAGDADPVAQAIASVESQLGSADRLKELSAATADRLRLMEARLDELVARAAEVSVGASDTNDYADDVDNLVVELEALRQAVAEVEQA